MGPEQPFAVSVDSFPPGGLYLGIDWSSSGIDNVSWVPAQNMQVNAVVRYSPPGWLGNGTYNDTITVSVCEDSRCARHVNGSPATIQSSYQVLGNGSAVVSVASTSITVDSDTAATGLKEVTIPLTVAPAVQSPVYMSTQVGGSVVRETFLSTFAGRTELTLRLEPGNKLAAGTYTDTVAAKICYDPTCKHQLAGSPLPLQVNYQVALRGDHAEPLPVQSRVALPHDVVDAEYSRSLDKLVMAASYPANALYVYDAATGTERSVLLSKLPTTVALSPDGRTVAVGHDAKVTVLDVATIGTSGAPAPILLDISRGRVPVIPGGTPGPGIPGQSEPYDLVLDARNQVHVMPRKDQWVEMHSIDIATNTESLSLASLREGSLGRLDRSGDFVYTVEARGNVDYIDKWDVRDKVPKWLYRQPAPNPNPHCGNLWFSEAGARIFTKCGNVFATSTMQGQDMVYTGKLQLPDSAVSRYWIQSLDYFGPRDEVALLEYNFAHCPPNRPQIDETPCLHHLGVFDGLNLNRMRLYELAPVSVGAGSFAQQGMVEGGTARAHDYCTMLR
jgi:hypothetical protein